MKHSKKATRCNAYKKDGKRCKMKCVGRYCKCHRAKSRRGRKGVKK